MVTSYSMGVKRPRRAWRRRAVARARPFRRQRQHQVGKRGAHLNHIKPHLGGRKVKDLRTDEVDRWLLKLSPKLSTSTLKQIRSVLNRSITSAVKAGLAERNVVDLSTVPRGRQGRRSRSLTLEQAEAVLQRHGSTRCTPTSSSRSSRVSAPKRHAHSSGSTSTWTRRRCPTPHRGVEVRPGRRRHEDSEVTANTRPLRSRRRSPDQAQERPRLGRRRGREPLEGPRPRVPLGGGHPAGPAQRVAHVPLGPDAGSRR